MPNRILKESICRSEEIDQLSWFEETLFYRLIVNCDDYGRYDGRAKIIKGSLYPLKDVTAKDIERGLEKLSAVGLVEIYTVDAKPYLQLVTWEQHQSVRARKSKYPGKDKVNNRPLANNCKQLQADEYNCKQLKSDECKCSRNPIQSESESESNTNISRKRETKKEKKHTYGKYKNILLTDTELQKLKEQFHDWNNKIENMSEAIAMKGYSYKSHYLALLKWAERDKTMPKNNAPSYDIDEFEKMSDFELLNGENNE